MIYASRVQRVNASLLPETAAAIDEPIGGIDTQQDVEQLRLREVEARGASLS
jgi:hypothetical protein